MPSATPEPGPGDRWLIDGNNVMGSRPDGWWRDRPAARARLVDELERWCRAGDRSVTVVFDGRGPGPTPRSGNPTVRFAGSGRPGAADDAIVALAAPGDTVVTADRGLIARLPPEVVVVGPSRLLEVIGSTRS